MKLYFSKNLLVFLIGFFITSCKDSITSENKEAWGRTTATIVEVGAYEDKYGYTFEYPIPESTAVNAEGRKIEGPIKQYGMEAKKPILNQKIPLEYLKSEPIFFNFLQPIEFE